MAEVNAFTFTHKEVVEALVKKQGIHEGLWVISVDFGLHAANAGPSEDQYLPTAIIPIVRFGIKRTDKVTNLSVNAAEVNPKTKSPKKASR